MFLKDQPLNDFDRVVNIYIYIILDLILIHADYRDALCVAIGFAKKIKSLRLWESRDEFSILIFFLLLIIYLNPYSKITSFINKISERLRTQSERKEKKKKKRRLQTAK